MSRSILVLSLTLLACRVAGYGEADQYGFPVWQDRANHLFVNAVRMDPTNYKSIMWNGFQPGPVNILTSYYPAQPPVYLTNGLLLSSYNHSLDMATYRPSCFQHPTCGSNQSPFTRIQEFSDCNGDLGENIAAGYSSPLDTQNQWLCDEYNNTCSGDGSGNDGHRSNIMSSAYTAIGVGYATSSSSSYTYYWTQDFSNCLEIGTGTYTSPIYGGSHYSLTGSSNTKFSAAWYDSAAPSSATVVIAGASSTLTLEMGTSTQGIYTVSLATSSVAACSQYYFEFGSTRFPDTGYLIVVGSSCTAAWVSGSGSPTTAPTSTTPAPTGSSVTTQAPTGSSVTTQAPTPAPSGSGIIFDSKLENGWTYYENGGGPAISTGSYQGETTLTVVLGGSTASDDFFWFSRGSAVNSTSFTNLYFTIAATSAITIDYYWDGEYTQSTSVSTSFTTVTTPLSNMLAPGHTALGSSGNELVFSNPGSSSVTIYLYNVQLGPTTNTNPTTAAAPTSSPTTAQPTTTPPTTVPPTTMPPTTVPPTTVPPTTVPPTTVPPTTVPPTTVLPTTVPPTTVPPTTVPPTTVPPTTVPPTTVPPTTVPPSTTQPTTAQPSPTAASTTVAATTQNPAPTTASAPPSGIIFDSNAENGWTWYENSGGSAIAIVTFRSQTALKVYLGASSASYNFFWFAHSTAVSSTSFTNLYFTIAASSTDTINYYFNGEYTQSVTATTSYTTITTPLSQMLVSGHTALGSSGNQLVFSNPSSSPITIYLYNVKLA